MSIKDIASGRSDLYRVKHSDLHIKEGWNSRNMNDVENINHVASLAVSIANVGMREPISVAYAENKLYVTNGHCRLAAIRLAIENETLPADFEVQAILEERKSTEAEQVFSQIVRNGGKPFTPLEQAKVFKTLSDFGWTNAEIAHKSGLSIVYVNSLLSVASAPVALKKMIGEGKVSATLAISTIKTLKGDSVAATKQLQEAVAEAKQAGKERATSKNVKKPTKAPVKKGEILAGFKELFKDYDWPSDEFPDAYTEVVLKVSDLQKLRDMLGIKPEKSANNDIV